jgi:hypothetical protein
LGDGFELDGAHACLSRSLHIVLTVVDEKDLPGLCPQAFEADPAKGSVWLHEAVLTGEDEVVEESEPGGGAP